MIINNFSAFEGGDSTLFCNVSGFSTTVSWKMYEVKRKGEPGTGFSEILPDLIMGAIHVMPTILAILVIKVYMSTSNVSFVSTTLIFVSSVVIFHLRFKSKIM